MAGQSDNVRAADADRQRVADQLRAALGEGRLTMDEYDDRVREAYAAKTYGELDRVLADLPGPAPAERSAVAQPDRARPAPVGGSGREHLPGWLWAVWGSWLAAVTINVVIWGLVSLGGGRPVYFWPMWVAGPWGVVLLFSTFSAVAGGGQARRWAEKQAKRERRRSH